MRKKKKIENAEIYKDEIMPFWSIHYIFEDVEYFITGFESEDCAKAYLSKITV